MSAADGPRVYVHLGVPKTGTTYLQEILWNNRDALARAGVLYPGDLPDAHFRAAMDLQDRQFQHDWVDPDVPGAWNELVQRARRWWHGPVIFSHELFCAAEPEHIDRALTDLDFAEVHLVCTARDAARQVPAVWQESIKNRHTVSYAEFSAGVRGDTESPHWLSELYRERQDVPAMLRKWARHVPAERVHVVTVPPRGQPSTLLWERFAGLVGIDPDSYDTTVRQSNASLGVAETELVRRLNHALNGQVDWPVHDSVVKNQLASDIFGSRKPRAPIAIPEEERSWVEKEAERQVAGLTEAGYDVVGDLRELLPTAPDSHPGVHPDHRDDREVLDVALEAIAALVRRIGELEAVSRPPDPVTVDRAPVGVRQTVRHLCDQHPALARIAQVYRAAKAGWSRLNRRMR